MSPRILPLAILLLTVALPVARAADDLLAFPEAQGAAARTPGGRGGKILRVTTLAPNGPGSLLAGLSARTTCTSVAAESAKYNPIVL